MMSPLSNLFLIEKIETPPVTRDREYTTMISVMLRMLSGDLIQLTVPKKTKVKQIEKEVYGLYPEIPMGSVSILHPSDTDTIPLLTDEETLNMEALRQLDKNGDLIRPPLYDGILLDVLVDDSWILPNMSTFEPFPIVTTSGRRYDTIRYKLSSYYDPRGRHPLRGRSLLSTYVYQRENGDWITYDLLFETPSFPKQWYPTLHDCLIASSLRFPRSDTWFELLEKEYQANRPSSSS